MQGALAFLPSRPDTTCLAGWSFEQIDRWQAPEASLLTIGRLLLQLSARGLCVQQMEVGQFRSMLADAGIDMPLWQLHRSLHTLARTERAVPGLDVTYVARLLPHDEAAQRLLDALNACDPARIDFGTIDLKAMLPGVSRRTAQTAIGRLVEVGYLERFGVGNYGRTGKRIDRLANLPTVHPRQSRTRRPGTAPRKRRGPTVRYSSRTGRRR